MEREPQIGPLIRMPDVLEMTGLSRSSINRRIAAGEFPKQLKLSTTGTRQAPIAFVLAEVQAWVSQRAASRNAKEAM